MAACPVPSSLRLACMLLAVAMLPAVGCTIPADGPTVLEIAPDRYELAFDAALAASDAFGFDPALRDRRQGIIETEPELSPSAFELWKTGPYSTQQVFENTTSMQRRWVRWEFTPRELPTEDQPADGHADLLNLSDQPTDLTRADSPIELRVVVFIERAYSPGVRPRTWTTSDTTRSVVIDPQTGEPVERSFWTPVARDERYERILLGDVATRLDAPPADSTASAAP